MTSALDRLKNFKLPTPKLPTSELPTSISTTPEIAPQSPEIHIREDGTEIIEIEKVEKLQTCEACPNQQKTLNKVKVSKMLLCDSCAAAEKEVPDPIPKDTTPEESKESQKIQEQVAALLNDPIAEYLGLSVDDLQNGERKSIFNDVALRLATATISEINEEYDKKMHYLKLVHFEAHMILVIKGEKIKGAKDKKQKERMLLEDLNWKQKEKEVKTPRVAKKISGGTTQPDFEIDAFPTEIRNAIRSMMKAGISKELAIAEVKKMRGGK